MKKLFKTNKIIILVNTYNTQIIIIVMKDLLSLLKTNIYINQE